MRIKRLLTAALCAVLAVVSCNMSSALDGDKVNRKNSVVVYAASTETMTEDGAVSVVSEEESQADTPETNAPQTNAPETNAPQTNAPETNAPQTNAPETNAPQTNAPETNAPQTNAPETNAPQTNAPETNAPQINAPETNAPQSSTESQTQVPTEGQTNTESQTQVPTEGQTNTESQTQVPTESQTNTESQTQVPTEGQTSTESQTQLPSETIPQTEISTEVPGTEAPLPGETIMTESAVEEDLELETEKKKKKKKKETESESESETSLYGSNEELIRHQNIVRPPDIELEFRFTQVDAEYAIVQVREGISVYEKRSEDSEAVGELTYYGVCCVLEDCGDGWYYIESRNVRGFVKAEHLATGEVAQRIVKVKGLEELPEARLLAARTENAAFDYTHTTVQDVLAEKVYAVADEETVNIYEQRKNTAKVVGILEEGALCYILADEEKDWVYVESGNARGFVEKDKLITGKKADKIVEETGENNMDLADVKIDPEDNEACYYTLTSVKEASESAKLREDIVNFALDYVGNPYVWGGTSLTNGADCSGFVQSVYAHFGYYLPRVAEAQAGYGMQIPVESAAPGDLIFYARNGYVYHVSMYIGNGRVVHAAGRTVGIITSGIDGNAVWATRIIQD